jgi:hypothetical protein
LSSLMVAFKLTDLEENVFHMRNDDQEMQVIQNMQTNKLRSSFYCSLESRAIHLWWDWEEKIQHCTCYLYWRFSISYFTWIHWPVFKTKCNSPSSPTSSA